MLDDRIKLPKPRLAEWLMEPMRRNRATYWKVALAATFINIFGLITALFTMTIYDRVIPNSAMSSLIALSIGLGIVIVFDFILKLLRAYFVDHAGSLIDRDIGEDVFARLLAMRLDRKTRSTGALAGLMDSGYQKGKKLETPHLNIAYKAPAKSWYAPGEGS